MPEEQAPSQYNQSSFKGGMCLLGDDTRLEPNQYRLGLNITNRLDELDLVPSSILDEFAPKGIKQGLTSFGNYLILFVAGSAYYKLYSNTIWTKINSFSMSAGAPKYWFVAVPVSVTNYLRFASTGTLTGKPNTQGTIQTAEVAGASKGNLPGLLVQDNINQPVFLFLDANGFPTARVTQAFNQWSVQFTDANNTTIAANGDNREYVPIGNEMAWDDATLYIVAPNLDQIYRSVSGRPLDFCVNVTNALVTAAPFIQKGGGDATTTSYTVGTGNITCIRYLSSGNLFVSASGACFAVTKNTTNNAIKEFGEYTFIRQFLFNAYCLSSRALIDSIGDTRFIDLNGIRSFNAVSQLDNEGRNSPFSQNIAVVLNEKVAQSALYSAAIIFNNYELYSIQTIFGPAIAKYDTINNCWVSFDISQTGGKRVKQFTALQIDVLALFAITEDDNVYQLYTSPTEFDKGSVRTVGVCSNMLYANENIKMNNPKSEVKLQNTRVIFNKITEDSYLYLTPFINNRISNRGTISKLVRYEAPQTVYQDEFTLDDVNTQITNALFATPDCEQGWKVFCILSWTGGVITQYSLEMLDLNPQNPMRSQETVI